MLSRKIDPNIKQYTPKLEICVNSHGLNTVSRKPDALLFKKKLFDFRFYIFTVSCDTVNEKFGKFLKWFSGKFKRE